MVIFVCCHYGFLSQMLVLRYKFHRNEKVILLIAKDSSRADIYCELENKKIFDKVIPFVFNKGRLNGNKERIKQVICNYFDSMFQENTIDLAAVDKVYIACDVSNSFGIYAYNKCIKYSMVEVAPGRLSDFSRYELFKGSDEVDKSYIELQREASALTGDEKLAEEYVLVIPRPQDKNYSTNKRMVYLDYTKELANLPNEIKEEILSIYNVSRNDFNIIDTLILTNNSGSISSRAGLREPKFPYLYQLLLDYYVAKAGNIVIKRHPYGLVHYTGKIPDIAGNLNANFPIEFIALFDDVRIKNIVVAGSTAVDKIRPYVDNAIEAGLGYYSNYYLLHRLYAAYSLLGSISNQSINFHQSLDLDFLQRYLYYIFPQYGSKELKRVDPNILEDNAFTVISSCPPTKEANICNGLQNAGKDAIIVFLNSNNNFDFYDVKRPELLEQMIPLKITKMPLRDDVLADMSDEYIYVFSKNSEVREKAKTFSVSRTLYYTGIEIKVVPLEDSEIELIKTEIRLAGMKTILDKAVGQLAETRKTTFPETSNIGLVKMKMSLEDMETAIKKVVNCLPEW